MEDNDICKKEQKEERILKEVTKLRQIFSKMDRKNKKAVLPLIQNAAFMTVTLEDLQEEINLNGTTEKYQNGENQFGTKKSSAVEIYNTTIKNYLTVMKQLTDLLAKTQEGDPGKDDDGFDGFVNNK